MKNTFLLPGNYKIIGWLLFLIFGTLGIFNINYEYKVPFLSAPNFSGSDLVSDGNLTNEFALAGSIIGLLMICFAKHKNEDEYITQVRLNSWQWSVLISYVILVLLNFTFYGGDFLIVLFYNTLTVPLIFIIRFYYSMYKLSNNNLER